jgi:hypothetical protein
VNFCPIRRAASFWMQPGPPKPYRACAETTCARDYIRIRGLREGFALSVG